MTLVVWYCVTRLLEAQGAPRARPDDLVAALEAGAVAGAQCQVVELDGMAPALSGLAVRGRVR
ncbi:hypothetical protein GCM10017744_000010 [Streptomyces antimycoticus]